MRRALHSLAASSPRGSLAAITADQAAQQAMPTSAISKRAGFTQQVYNDILQAAQSGQFVGFQPAGDCSGTSSVKPAILSTAGGLALTFGKFAGPAAPFVLAGGAIATIFGIVFGHHSAAVAAERKVICAAVPAANDALAAIYQAVQNGTMSPQQGQQALAGLLQQFMSTVQPIIKNDATHCNAACVWVKELTAIVAYQTSVYQDMIDNTGPSASTPAGAITGAIAAPVNALATQFGIPPIALYIGGAFLLWQLL